MTNRFLIFGCVFALIYVKCAVSPACSLHFKGTPPLLKRLGRFVDAEAILTQEAAPQAASN
jgi:hypothetical protein